MFESRPTSSRAAAEAELGSKLYRGIHDGAIVVLGSKVSFFPRILRLSYV
jgi:hypothetical protein